MKQHDIGVIGSGPAALTAAIYAARSQYSVVVLAGTQPLGQLMNTTYVENYPGYVSVKGSELMEQMKLQTTHCGASFIEENATSIEIIDGLFKVQTEQEVYFFRTCIVATGSKPKLLELDSEKKFWNLGISTCATCDGPLYRNKTVCVIGGGNTAAEEVIFLAGICEKVYLIHRRDEMRAEQILQKRLFSLENVECLWDSEVQEFLGEESLTHVLVYNKKTEEAQKIAVDAAFIAIGHTPQTELVKDLCKLKEGGYIKTVAPRTNLPGLFVAGDIADNIYRQAATAVGDGCRAGISAIKFLQMGLKVEKDALEELFEPRSERRSRDSRAPREGGFDRERRRPDGDRGERRERRSDDRPSFGERRSGDRGAGRHESRGSDRGPGDRPSFGERRSFGERSSFGGERRDRGPGDRPSFGERRSFGDRSGGARFDDRGRSGDRFDDRRRSGASFDRSSERRSSEKSEGFTSSLRPQFGAERALPIKVGEEKKEFRTRSGFGGGRSFGGGSRGGFGKKPTFGKRFDRPKRAF